MSTHAHGSGHDHHGPSNFFTKYVFSTDHKVIGIQFTFASLLFVILGGLLALGVRYQLAWPNQHVPYAKLLPGKMTNQAPEANLGLWKLGGAVEINKQVRHGGVAIEPGAKATLVGFPEGLAVTVPVGTQVESDSGHARTLEEPMDAFIAWQDVLAGYDYAKQEVLAVCGTEVTVPALDGQPQRTFILTGLAKNMIGGTGRATHQVAAGSISLPLRPDAAVYLPEGCGVIHDDTQRRETLAQRLLVHVSAADLVDYHIEQGTAALKPGTQVSTPARKDAGAESFEIIGVGQEDSPVPVQVVITPTLAPIEDLAPPTGTGAQANSGFSDIGLVVANNLTHHKQVLTTDAYLQLFTMHASVMIFLVIIPMLVGGFGNFLIPLMIGARDMAFPKLNMLSFWIAVPAGVVMLISFWTPGGAAGGGWTMYPTLSESAYSPNIGTTLWVAAVGLIGFSSITGALNYITTILNMRAPGMTMFRMPLTVWALLITSILSIFATPMLTAAMVLLLLDRTLGTMFFLPEGGGQPLMWQHIFWFYSHPAVYIMILPAMGVVSDILATFARKPIFGYKPMIYAMMAITGLGFIVWGHHMFQSGMNPVLGTTFMASTIMIAVPSAIKTFNWLGTLWGGNIQFTPAMLNALGFVSMFVIGGLSGIFMASAPVDIPIHDTYFIVAHIHYVLFGGSLFGIYAGIYHWFPKMFGRQMNQKWGVIHFVMTIIAFNGTFFLMHILGIGGHPRRYATIMEYPTLQHLQPLNVVMTIFAMMLGAAQLPFFYNVFASLPRKLGRAVSAAFVVVLGLPFVIGLTFWGQYDSQEANFIGAMGAGLFYALIFSAVTVGVVFVVWAVGGMLRVPAVLEKLLYVVFLPAFLSPLLLKKDPYLWLGKPGWYPETLWEVLLVLGIFAIPGLVYLLLWRPKDEFGSDPGVNPWQANSLEWSTSSPPPHLNFDEIPSVHRGPYEYSSPVVEEDYLPQVKVLAADVIEPTGH